MVVERKYVTKRKGRWIAVWKVVDYKTTHSLAAPRPCPAGALPGLLQTAF